MKPQALAVLGVAALVATTTQAQVGSGPALRTSQSSTIELTTPAATMVPPALSRTAGSTFALRGEAREFTYRVQAARGGTFIAGAEWRGGFALVLRVDTGQGPRETDGRTPLMLEFELDAGQTATITIMTPTPRLTGVEGDLCIVRKAAAGQRQRKSMLSRDQRIESLVGEKRRSSLLPLLVNLAERHINAYGDKTDLDRLFDGVIADQPGGGTSSVNTLLQLYENIPDRVKRRALTPDSLAQRNRRNPTIAGIPRALLPGVSNAQLAVTAPALISPRPFTPLGFGELRAQVTTPIITEIVPRLPAGVAYEAGAVVTVVGSGFSNDIKQNLVMVGHDPNRLHLHPQWPLAATTTQLVIQLPPGLRTGTALLQVTVTARGTSNRLELPTLEQTEEGSLRPIIQSLQPAEPRPGQDFVITARNLAAGRPYELRVMSAVPGDDTIHTAPLTLISTTQLRGRLPQSVVPGNNGLWVWCATGPNTIDGFPITVRPSHFRIMFTKMRCEDESNPEWSGSDEVVTYWTVAADRRAFAKCSAMYEGFDGGTVAGYSKEDQGTLPEVATAWDAGEPVTDGIGLAVACYEWDSDAPDSGLFPFGLLNSFTDALATVTKSNRTPTAWGSPADTLFDWFGCAPDLIGTQMATWSAVQLQQMVAAGETRTFTMDVRRGPTFREYDEMGWYRLTYCINRVD